MSLDVRTKLCLLLLANACLFFRIEGYLSYLIIGSFLGILALLGQKRLSISLGTVYLILLVFSVIDVDVVSYQPIRFLAFFALAGKLLFPSLLAAFILLKTTTVYELVHGLRKCRVPELVLLTFAVMVRFLPTIKQESKVIHRALKIRGIYLTKWQIFRYPSRYLEYILVPLLLSLVRNSQHLTIASLTKGLALKNATSECFVSQLTWKDWGIQFWSLITILYMMMQSL